MLAEISVAGMAKVIERLGETDKLKATLACSAAIRRLANISRLRDCSDSPLSSPRRRGPIRRVPELWRHQ